MFRRCSSAITAHGREANGLRYDDLMMSTPGRTPRLAGYAARALYRVQDSAFDRILGVSTREPVLTAGVDRENAPYSSSSWLPVLRALRRLSPGPGDVLADLGSGKGAVLLLAGLAGFPRVIGIEIDPQLCGQARRNIKRARFRPQAQAQVVTASAADWPVPDEVTTVFTFNSFTGQVFRSAMGQVFASYDRRPRELRIVYAHPWEHDWLISTGRVIAVEVISRVQPTRPGWWQTGKVIVTYLVTPQGSGHPLPHRTGRQGRILEHWSGLTGYGAGRTCSWEDFLGGTC